MKLITFKHKSLQQVGLERDGKVVGIVSAAAILAPDLAPALSGDMIELLRDWETSFAGLKRLEDLIHGSTGDQIQWRDLSEVTLLAPIPRPGKILCSGINYRGHMEENPAAKMPEEPFFFAKMPSCVIGPNMPIRYPSQTQQLDYEVEFAAVIGRRMQAVKEETVMDGIAGYTILHDVSARDVQFKDSQITLGKNFDTFCPIGPCIVTPDELKHPDQAGLRSFVNGDIRQNGSNRDWIFSLPKLLSFLSHVMTLEPGDIVSTGTPAGVGLFQNPQTFLNPGDVVCLEIDGIGALENPVLAN